MSAANYTKGPWRFHFGREETSIQVWGTIERIANCDASKAIGFPEKKANALLISAAPDLLEALQSLVTPDGYTVAVSKSDVRAIAARAAIDKANGRAPK